MIRQAKILPGEKAAFAGEVQSLLEQLGSPDSGFSLADAFPELSQLNNVESLQDFLCVYEARILIPVELPAIHQAYLHASRNECRELIALDQKLAVDQRVEQLSSASQKVGCAHLNHLRPMRDNRLVQRYLQAIENGEAHGWHTLVYGLTLAIYSLPLRQGLTAYAQKTLGAFADCAARSLGLSAKDSAELLDPHLSILPEQIERLLAPVSITLHSV